MAQYNRPPKQKEKKTDEFISFFDHLVRYFMIHRIKLYVVFALVLLGFTAYGVFLYWESKRVTEFATLYDKAVQAPETEAMKIWEEISQKNPPLELDDVISMQMAGILVKENKWEQAAQKFSLSSRSSSDVLKFLGQWGEAVSLENAKQFDKAFKSYQHLSQDENNPFKEYGNLGMARCLNLQGKRAESERLLNTLVALDSKAPPAVKTAARDQLLLLKMDRP